ncbi:MAG: amidohydrolase family protein [Desulfurivibrionaceae bacterium]
MVRECDLLIYGTVLPVAGGDEFIEDGAVVVQGTTIAEVGGRRELEARYSPRESLGLDRGLVMPGLVNLHTHAPMSCMRGMADDLPLMVWLQEHIFPAEQKLTSEIVYQSSLLSGIEMIKSGTTTFCDMYLFAGDVACAAREIGLRGAVGEVIFDFPSPNYGDKEAGLAYVREMFATYGEDTLIRVTVDPHSVYTCSPDLLLELKDLADEFKAPYVIHLSESKDEVNDVIQRYDRTPVHHLDHLGILDSRTVADHCVMLSDSEIHLLAEKGASVCHCPESNMKLASGVAPVPDLLAAGVNVGLGSDGSASNNDVDLFAEMDSAAKLHKVHRRDPTVMSARETLYMATQGGARALKAENEIGSLEPGKKADIIVLNLDQPHLTPMYDISSHLVYAARGGDVVHSVVNGRIVMRDRLMTTVDESAIFSGMREVGRILAG